MRQTLDTYSGLEIVVLAGGLESVVQQNWCRAQRDLSYQDLEAVHPHSPREVLHLEQHQLPEGTH